MEVLKLRLVMWSTENAVKWMMRPKKGSAGDKTGNRSYKKRVSGRDGKWVVGLKNERWKLKTDSGPGKGWWWSLKTGSRA
jgi:hypothetical protein